MDDDVTITALLGCLGVSCAVVCVSICPDVWTVLGWIALGFLGGAEIALGCLLWYRGIRWFVRGPWHELAHVTGWNHGQVETWWKGDRLMVGFRCRCGRIQHAHEVRCSARRES